MKITRPLFQLLFPVLLLVVATGCAGATPTSSVDQVGTIVAATLQAITAAAPTSTLVPSSTSIPLATPTVPVPTVPTAVRFNFATGATFGTAQGTLQPNQSLTYVIGASQAQPMIIMADAANHDVTFSLTGKNGVALVTDSQGLSSWQGLLPATQDYYLKVNAGASAENYTLSITIASRIQFASGATSAKVTGNTANGYNVSYVLRASSGQTMNINLTAPAGDGVLQVWGFNDGQPYLRYVVESTTFNMVLPSTQDYIVEVVPRAGMVINYSMTVEIK
jgi:hypothetical protein